MTNQDTRRMLKAERLLDEGRVTDLTETGVRVFSVDGDHAQYIAVIHPASGQEFCSCPSTDRCSHLAAASRMILRETIPADPFEGLVVNPEVGCEAVPADLSGGASEPQDRIGLLLLDARQRVAAANPRWSKARQAEAQRGVSQ